jgi:hypothetical protein
MKALCTRAAGGRTLKLRQEAIHQAQERRWEEQRTPAFLQRYHRHAGVEGTLSQAVSTTRMRCSPYIGLQKTHLHHVTIAAGMNLVRIGDHLQAQTCGKPSCRSHPQSAFARLQPLDEAC